MRGARLPEFSQTGNKAGGLCPHMPFCFVLHTRGIFFFPPTWEFSLSLELFKANTFHPPAKATSGRALSRRPSDVLKITSGSAVTLKSADKILTQRGKLEIFQCHFYCNNLEYLHALWQPKGNIFPQSKSDPFSSGAEGSFCPFCQDHPQMKGDGNGNTKYSPLFTSPAATNLGQHQCREKVLSKVGVREEEENSVFAMSQNFPSHPPHPCQSP